MRPSDRSYLESHEWAKLDGDVVTVGITDFAVEQLGELVYLDLPSVGDSVSSGDAFGEVESVKAVSDLNSPVGGEIVAVNDGLADELDALQNAPMAGGWLIQVRVSGADAMDGMLDAAAYEELVVAQS
ncbi:MAG: glycine cleavage system protein GcvH [Planctomycetes bacterium]|nr:glycine cleavage system protein GcvH [Planctomycetota bacterium]